MTHWQHNIMVVTLGAAFAGACIETDVGDTRQAVLSVNALSVNALSVNALSVNALSVNALSVNALSVNSFELDADATDLGESELGREVLNYVARCALAAGTELVTEYDGTTYHFPGSLGLAPSWLDEPLDLNDGYWVSACLLAHASSTGVEVSISLRGAHPSLATTKSERKHFKSLEGAFYGDLFAASPVMASCAGDNGVISADRALRRCTDLANAGTTECNFIASGDCTDLDVCTDQGGHPNHAFADCAAISAQFSQVATVYLRSD